MNDTDVYLSRHCGSTGDLPARPYSETREEGRDSLPSSLEGHSKVLSESSTQSSTHRVGVIKHSEQSDYCAHTARITQGAPTCITLSIFALLVVLPAIVQVPACVYVNSLLVPTCAYTLQDRSVLVDRSVTPVMSSTNLRDTTPQQQR
jgi:hypothetical protein